MVLFMDDLSILTLKIFRKLYSKSPFGNKLPTPEYVKGPDEVGEIIFKALKNDKPCMISRFMTVEFNCLYNYLGVKNNKKSILAYIKGDIPPWWWEEKTLSRLHLNAGFFPLETEKVVRYSQLMLNDISQVDILGSWRPQEFYFRNEFKSAQKVELLFLDPFWAKAPWTNALEGKKVLVVYPLSNLIEQQYKKRKQLFKNSLLPEFELKTLKAVQSIAGIKTNFQDWFEALEYMKNEIDKIDYDICLIGAGAYGFPLAAHVKRMGKKGVHLGSTIQLLFGIKGKRWENNYNTVYDYPGLFNEYWIRPGEEDKPPNAQVVEGGCYW